MRHAFLALGPAQSPLSAAERPMPRERAIKMPVAASASAHGAHRLGRTVADAGYGLAYTRRAGLGPVTIQDDPRRDGA